MTVTGAVLGEALRAVGAGSRLVRPLDELAAGADAALRQAPPGLTARGAASFLATCCQESDYLRTTREYGSGQRYAPFIGRGFVQCTWRENYDKFGAWCHRHGLVDDPDVFVKNPRALEDYRWAWLTATWYFESTGLWRHANAGDHYAVSQGVNRGPGAIGTSKAPLHWDARKRMFDVLLRAEEALLPDGAARPTLREGSTGPLVGAVIEWANSMFRGRLYPMLPILLLDPPLFGPGTRAFVETYQQRRGLKVDGVIGPVTWADFRVVGFRG